MQRRDRTGDLIDDDGPAEPGPVIVRCADGWLIDDGARPRACPTCKPWLCAVPARPPTADELAERRRCSGLVALTTTPNERTP